MRTSILVLVAGVVGALGTHFLMTDRGLVLVNWRGVEYTTSVPGAILLLLLAYLLLRLAMRLLRAPRKFGEAVGRQRMERGKRKMTEGLIQMAEGNWSRSERILAQGAKTSQTPLLNYLNAARAAQLQGAHERRDNWLMLAYEQDKDAANAVLLTQAELQIDHGQHEEALATLRRLNESAPGHAQGLALLSSIYRELGDWDNLRDLLPQLRKKKALSVAALDELTCVTFMQSISATGRSGDAAQLEKLWQSIPKKFREDPVVLHAYIGALTDSKQAVAAERVLRKALVVKWEKELVLDYGRLETEQTAKQLSHAEAWLKTYPNDAALLLSAARLAMRTELWGKARSYLESSLAIEPRIDAYHLYGQLLETMGETDGAAGAFRLGLNLATGVDSKIPTLTGPRDET